MAGGVLGADAVAKSQPDGYGLGMGSIATNAIAVGTYAKLLGEFPPGEARFEPQPLQSCLERAP